MLVDSHGVILLKNTEVGVFFKKAAFLLSPVSCALGAKLSAIEVETWWSSQNEFTFP